jgi:MSHA biogenesis protein MshK
MVEYLKKRTMWLTCLAGVLLCAGVQAAQALTDPTRPPSSMAGDAQPGMQVAPSGPVLQSVLIAPGRKVAIISGATVQVGDKVGEARVVKIAEGEVVLRNGKDTQTLKLYPDVEKLPVSSRHGSKLEPGGNKGK